MASEDAPGKGENGRPEAGPRHRSGPRSVGSLLPGITRAAFRSRSAAGAQLMADWPAIVGPALSRISAPRHLNRTTLTLACSGPVALELQHLADQLAGRINAHYGRTVVEQLRFVQGTAPVAAAAAPGAASRAAPTRPIEIAGMEAGGLRDALAALGGAVAQAAAERPAASRPAQAAKTQAAKTRAAPPARRLTPARGSGA